jgi:hypothetical protein
MRCQLTILAIASAALLAVGVATGGTAAAQPRQELTVYSVASGTQFLSHDDDRRRGITNNPFDPRTNKLQPPITTGGTGETAGDIAVYSFDLFTAPNQKKSAGEASYLCYFNYNSRALCMAYYELKGREGTVIASGPVDFTKRGFKLVVTGGTQNYAGYRGQVASETATENAQRLRLVLLKQAPRSAASAKARNLTLHSVAQTAQFINHADDRLRGMGTNPFNVKTQNLVIVTKGTEKEDGPFPGDDVLYTRKLFATAAHDKSAGSAVYTCYYTFQKRAVCHAYFALDGGLVLASGSVPYNSSRYTLSVTGGTGAYLGVHGSVRATPGKNSHLLSMRLQGLPA